MLPGEALGVVEEPSQRLPADAFGLGAAEFPGARLERLVLGLEVVLLTSHADMIAVNR